jgi:hypothetical protein
MYQIVCAAFISRTSGISKHLLMEYTPTKITQNGFIAFLDAYYKPSLELKQKFKDFIRYKGLKKTNWFKKLSKFFKENPLDFSLTEDKFLYFALLHIEIGKTIKTRKTAMCIEIDAVASGLTILANFLRNKLMAIKSNVCGGEKSDTYQYCMEKFPDC